MLMIIMCVLQAEVFGAEECRDHEKAQGALDKLQKQLDGHKLVVQEEVKEIMSYKEQSTQVKC